MRSKKTYEEYKKDRNVKFPVAAWILDRSTLYVAVAIVALLAIGGFAKLGWDSYSRAIQEPEVISPYIDMESASSTGRTWAKELASKAPTGVTTWALNEKTKPQPFVDYKICPTVAEIPTTLLSTHIASGEGIETRVQVYGAGQATAQFDTYINALNSCFGETTIQTSGNTRFAEFPGGFVITAGDAIVGSTTADPNRYDAILDFYLNNVERTLEETGCIALAPAASDAKRSFFYDRESYIGLEEKEELESNVNIAGLPTPAEIKLNEIANENAILPEAPLPPDFPELPKNEVKPPVIPTSVQDQSMFAGVAVYKIADTKGPGCGWDWSAQESPVYDDKSLENMKKNSIQQTKNDVDSKAIDYVKTKINWALQVAAIAPAADDWNIFVNKTNEVHEKWEWLENERAKVQTDWYNYVAAHDDWFTFDERKAAAIKQFEEDTKKCEADKKALEDWEDKWEELAEEREKEKEKENPEPSKSPSPSPSASISPTPSPSPTVEIPEKPVGCDTPPERPEIADQEKPQEPQPPFIPVGVTIPQSWPVPKG